MTPTILMGGDCPLGNTTGQKKKKQFLFFCRSGHSSTNFFTPPHPDNFADVGTHVPSDSGGDLQELIVAVFVCGIGLGHENEIYEPVKYLKNGD